MFSRQRLVLAWERLNHSSEHGATIVRHEAKLFCNSGARPRCYLRQCWLKTSGKVRSVPGVPSMLERVESRYQKRAVPA